MAVAAGRSTRTLGPSTCTNARDSPSVELEVQQTQRAFAEQFAADWIDAWNAHDLDRVMSHYADDFEMSSPFIVQVASEPSGTLRGKAAVGAYWKKALELILDLHFELISVLVGVTSVTLYYKGARGRLAAEVFHFGAEQKVSKAFAHYDASAAP
jgi:ketosteroid isomerase-like protein